MNVWTPPRTRAKIKAVVIERIKFDRGGGDPANVVMARCTWDKSLDGKNLAEITKMRGREVNFENAAETLLEIQHSGGCQGIFHAISEDDVERIMKYPFTMVGSDGEIPQFGVGAPHPRSYGTFARVLGRYVREKPRDHAGRRHPQNVGAAGAAIEVVRPRPDPPRNESGHRGIRSGDGGG